MKFIKCSVFVLLCTLSLPGFSRESSSLNAELSDFTLPEYNAKGKLEYIAYGKEAKFKGTSVDFKDVIINLLTKDIKSVMAAGSQTDLKIYPIDEKLSRIKEFWKKLKYTRAVIETKKGQYDRITKTVKGDGEIKLRSPQIDLDGVGFDADYGAQTIFIRSKVKVVLRMKGGTEK